ncbi:heme-binding protein [Sphingomonas histidinilytica]|nr:heme-binding protein [Rhizorhabdus histidinilytica]
MHSRAVSRGHGMTIMLRSSLAIAAGLLVATTAAAQTARPALDYASAAKIRDTCLDWASKNGKRMTVAVMDTHGMLVAYAHMDGASYQAGEVARWKATAASRFGRSTADLARLNPAANVPNVATIPGGLPIYTSAGVALGGVGVSGGKIDEDVACGTAGIAAAGLSADKPAS